MTPLNCCVSFIIISQNNRKIEMFLYFLLPYQVKIKSQRNGFFYLPMAFQKGFEPSTDSLEGILFMF